MPLDVQSLRTAISAIAAKLEVEYEILNELDGRVGDGDLGVTLLKAFRELHRTKGELADDLGLALIHGAGAVARVSSSSFGTLLATGMIAVGKQVKGSTSVPWSEVSALLEQALEAMAVRGKANRGDKTVLDAIAGAAAGAAGKETPKAIQQAALAEVDAALDAFRNKPNKVGRARIFAERTIGLDDPGMVAVKFMLEALKASS